MPPLEQHRNAVRASNILYAGLGVSFLLSASGLVTAQLPAGTWSPLFGMVLLVHLLAALLYYAIRLGKRWAKRLLLLFVAFNVVSTGWSLLSGNEAVVRAWRANVWDALKEASTFVADIVALVLLFRKAPVQAAPFH